MSSETSTEVRTVTSVAADMGLRSRVTAEWALEYPFLVLLYVYSSIALSFEGVHDRLRQVTKEPLPQSRPTLGGKLK